jgi:cyanate permease
MRNDSIGYTTIYSMHWWIEILVMKVMRSLFSQGVWMSTLVTLVTLPVAVFVPCLISKVLNRFKLKWIFG